MKILYLTPWFPNHRQDQHGNFILDSIEALVDAGHEVTVLVTRPWRPKLAGLINKEWIKKQIQLEQFSDKFNLHICHYLSFPRSYFCSFSFWNYRKRVNPIIRNLLQRYQCQLIHAHTELAGISAVDIGLELNIPTVITLHGISTEKKLYSGETRKLLFEYTLQNTNRVILVGHPLVDFAKQFVKKHDHFRTIFNGFRFHLENEVHNKQYWPKNQLRFISVSNLVEGKGIEINLQALAKLKEIGITEWVYKVIGDGVERKNLEILTDKLGLNRYVHFLGACHHNEVYIQLAQSDIFILPSYREAFGVAYLEAMSFGLLTIGVEGQGPQAFIEHGITGLLVAPKNIEVLVNMVKEIYQSREQMLKIAIAGKNHVHRRFTWQCHANNLTKVYRELVKE